MTPRSTATGPRTASRGGCRPGSRAVVMFLAALAAAMSCSSEDPPTALTLVRVQEIRGGAIDRDGNLYLQGVRSVFVVPPRPRFGSSINPTLPVAAEDGDVLGVNRDAGGQVWVFAGYDHAVQVVGLSGPVANRVHPADERVGALLGVHDRLGADDEPVDPVPPNLPLHHRFLGAGAVVDSDSVLVSTGGRCEFSGVRACDAMVWRVTSTDTVPVAGRVSPLKIVKGDSGRWLEPVLRAPAQELPVGQAVSAREVDLPTVLAVLPLPVGRTLIIAGGSEALTTTAPGRVWAFVIEGGHIRRLSTPAGMTTVPHVGLSPVSGGRALLTGSVPDGATNWLIDPQAGSVGLLPAHDETLVGDGSNAYIRALVSEGEQRVTLVPGQIPADE
jgi:hypothetical protein